MKLLGDVPEEHQEIAEELIEYEKTLDNDNYSVEKKAQSCVCLAHDWYQIGMEEEGARLLKRAEEFYPGYFKKKMIQHTVESKEFDKIVKNIMIELMWMIANQLKDK